MTSIWALRCHARSKALIYRPAPQRAGRQYPADTADLACIRFLL